MNDRADSVSAPARPPARVVSVFQIDDDERLEHQATLGRGTRRLAATARLAARYRRDRRRPAGHGATATPAAAKPASVTERPPVHERPPAKVRAAGAPRRTAPARQSPAGRAAGARGGDMTPAQLRRARTAHQARLRHTPPDPGEVVADERAWDRWASDAGAGPGGDGLERLDLPRRPLHLGHHRPGSRRGLRQRASEALDRLAEREVTRGERLERALVPRRRTARPG